MKIILVGNGKSVTKFPGLGKKIDEFDIVARFNNFQHEGYEEYVGTKMDWFCRRSCDDITLHPYDTFDKVYNFITFCPLTSGMKSVAKFIHQFYKDKYNEVNSSLCKKIAEDIGLNHNKERASVGALAIGYFTAIYDKIWICGFDRVLDPDDETQVHHYYPRKPLDSKYHAWAKEANYILNLIEQDKVEILK